MTAAGILFLVVALGIAGGRWGYVSWKLHIARAQLADSELRDALASLRAAEKVDPDRPELLFLLAKACRRLGKTEQALALLDRADAAGWPAEQLRNQRYLARIQTGHFDDAQPFLRDAFSRKTSDELAAETYEALAAGYMYAFRFHDALLCLNYWIKWRPDAVRARLLRAEIWEWTEQWQAARDEYRIVLQSRPDHLEANRKLANCLLELNDPKAASEHYRNCLNIEPNHVETRIGFAKCQRRLANVEEARRLLVELLSGDLDSTSRVAVLVELAQIALDRKEDRRAISWLKQALQIDPRNATAHQSLATVFSRRGRTALAKNHFAQAVEIREQFDRMTRITRELIDHPENADLRFEAGMILMKQGLKKEGAAWMSTALMYDPRHRKTHEALARYYAGLERKNLAEHHRAMAQSAGQTRQPLVQQSDKQQ